MAKKYYQGHGSFRLTTDKGTVIYVDPYAGKGYDVPADLILITHEHYDHTAVEKVNCKDSCKVYRSGDTLINGEYKTFVEKDVKFTAVPATNKNHAIDKCVGYIIEIDGLKIYAAGDTSTTEFMPKMADMNIDYAILPTDGIYNMDPVEASECAKMINAKTTIPIHNKPGELFDISMADKFHCEGKKVVLPDEEIVL